MTKEKLMFCLIFFLLLIVFIFWLRFLPLEFKKEGIKEERLFQILSDFLKKTSYFWQEAKENFLLKKSFQPKNLPLTNEEIEKLKNKVIEKAKNYEFEGGKKP